MSEIAYEMLWDCRFCGQKKLLGLSHRHCPSCGAPQNAENRYFPSDADKVRAGDHEYAGADLVCAHCGDASGRKAKHCGGCGAPLEGGKEIARRTHLAQAAVLAVGTTPKPGRFRNVFRVGCGALLLAAVVVVVALFWKREGTLAVTGHAWRREITIEVFGPVSDSSWCDGVPGAARGIRRSREVRSHRRVQDGQDCRTHQVDRGNGTFVEKEECSPRYRDEPVYDDRCYYVVDRWSAARKLEASGSSVTEAPRWPEIALSRAGTCQGCERAGARTETYTVELTGAKSGKQTCVFDEARWASFRDGSSYRGEIRVMNGSLDCETLRVN